MQQPAGNHSSSINTPLKRSPIKRSPLAKRLIIYMILFSAGITFIITAVQLYNEYQRDVQELESVFVQIEKVHLRSFTYSLWATNYQELKVQMEGLMTLPNVIYASIYNGKNSIVEMGKVDTEHFVKYQYKMEYHFLGKNNVIGELTVIATLDNIYNELLRDAITILVNNALRTLLVVLFVFFIFYRLITRHLSLIAQYFQKISLDKITPLVLDREKPNEYDELDLLVSSANEMQERIVESHRAYNESEKKFRTLTSVSPVGIFYTNVLGECLYVNKKWSEITGMSESDALGSGWVKGLHPHDKERVFNAWSEGAKMGAPFELEYRFQSAEKINWVFGQAISEKNEKGDIVGYVGTITDISERTKTEQALKESEEKLRIIHSQVPGIVYQFKIDKDGNRFLLYVSPAVEKYIGLSAETAMKDVNKWFDLIHPDDYPGLQESLLDSLVNLSRWQWEGRFVREDGEVVWLRGTATPERLADGGTGWNGLFIDVTEQVLNDELVRRSQKMDALGKLTGGIAHDYNNMLGVVLGYSELLASKLSDQPHLQNYVKKITHAGERGAKLTKKLLSFSKRKSSDVDIVSINNILNDERHMLEKTLTARIKLHYKLAIDCWSVCLDESELEDAILNMSINAMHAIENNGELIIETENLSIAESEADGLGLMSGDYVCLTLSDSGYGMDEETRQKVFDPFYTTKGDKGTGLGLSQVYGFVSRCGGAIKLESGLQQGTKIALYFPRYNGTDNKKVINLESSNKNLQGKENILVVDDEFALLELINEILRAQNYQVFCAESAKRALQILETEKIDVMISDIIMPDMNGYALASVVRKKYPQIKIQLVSGFSEVVPENKANLDLYENRLNKPYHATILLERVRKLLKNSYHA